MICLCCGAQNTLQYVKQIAGRNAYRVTKAGRQGKLIKSEPAVEDNSASVVCFNCNARGFIDHTDDGKPYFNSIVGGFISQLK